jgi:hypothetical protein
MANTAEIIAIYPNPRDITLEGEGERRGERWLVGEWVGRGEEDESCHTQQLWMHTWARHCGNDTGVVLVEGEQPQPAHDCPPTELLGLQRKLTSPGQYDRDRAKSNFIITLPYLHMCNYRRM